MHNETTERASAEVRKKALDDQIAMLVAQGGRVESQSDFQAVLIFGHRPNHVLHAILTVFTCLLWGIIWAIITGTGGEKRMLVRVNDWGTCTVAQM